MPRISTKKEEKISEQIINFLFVKSPELLFTSQIAEEVARDEEYIKALLIRMESKGLITRVSKNPEGFLYQKRIRWRISTKAYDALKALNNSQI